MTFHDEQFPTTISFGAKVDIEYQPSVIVTGDDKPVVVERWSGGRRSYDVSFGIKRSEDLAEVLTFFHARSGRQNTFRFKDWTDFTTAIDHVSAPTMLDQFIGHGEGTGVSQVVPLGKHYTNGAYSATRSIQLPIASTLQVAVNGVLTSNYSLSSASSGLLVFNAPHPADGAVITFGCEFDTPVRFDNETLETELPAYDAKSVKSVKLIEANSQSLDLMCFKDRRSMTVTPSKVLELTGASPRVVNILDVSGSSGILSLPDPSTIPLGGPIFIVRLVATKTLFVISRPDSDAVVTMTGPDSRFMFIIGVDANGTSLWRAIELP
jgi:uncharacterized protein (TIGR02217 family)